MISWRIWVELGGVRNSIKIFTLVSRYGDWFLSGLDEMTPQPEMEPLPRKQTGTVEAKCKKAKQGQKVIVRADLRNTDHFKVHCIP